MPYNGRITTKHTHYKEGNMITANLHNQYKHLQVDGKKMVLTLSNGETYPVKGIREANKVCKQLNVKPWNF
tara:strand:+ start:380 stop:592 length:213 start_codon:yes stop_codon:yes gene_type:complete